MQWKINTECYFGKTANFKFLDNIAAFDLDNTLIKPKSKSKFSVDSDDWTWNYDNVPAILNDYISKSYSIVIISNQGGIKKDETKGKEWIEKIEKIEKVAKSLGIDFYIFCSIDKNIYRKPLATIWEKIISKESKCEKSFYCGDAAGRKNDFSDTDYKFALNCKIPFFTPEHIFLQKPNDLPTLSYFNDFSNNIQNNKYYETLDNIVTQKHLVIMVGYPGSGKSHVAAYLQNKHKYVVVNQDTLKTKAKCIKNAENHMKKQDCVVIDNTNPNKNVRKEYIDLAKTYSYYITIINMTASLNQSKHNNVFRATFENHITNREIVPDIAYKMYKYEAPALDENVDEIIEMKPLLPNNPNYHSYFF